MSAELLRRAAKTIRDHGDPDIVKDYNKYQDLLTDPAVFAALADMLGEVAESLEQDGDVVQDSTTAGAVTVARAILREPS
jgi:hypothetical protein